LFSPPGGTFFRFGERAATRGARPPPFFAGGSRLFFPFSVCFPSRLRPCFPAPPFPIRHFGSPHFFARVLDWASLYTRSGGPFPVVLLRDSTSGVPEEEVLVPNLAPEGTPNFFLRSVTAIFFTKFPLKGAQEFFYLPRDADRGLPRRNVLAPATDFPPLLVLTRLGFPPPPRKKFQHLLLRCLLSQRTHRGIGSVGIDSFTVEAPVSFLSLPQPLHQSLTTPYTPSRIASGPVFFVPFSRLPPNVSLPWSNLPNRPPKFFFFCLDLVLPRVAPSPSPFPFRHHSHEWVFDPLHTPGS